MISVKSCLDPKLLFLNRLPVRAEDTRVREQPLPLPGASCWDRRHPELSMLSQQPGLMARLMLVVGFPHNCGEKGFALVQCLPPGFCLSAAGAGLGLSRQFPCGKRLL